MLLSDVPARLKPRPHGHILRCHANSASELARSRFARCPEGALARSIAIEIDMGDSPHERTAYGKRVGSSRPSTTTRVIVFAVLVAGILGLALTLTRPRELSSVGTDAAVPVDVEVRIDMNGFMPEELRVPAGRPMRIRFVNPDNSLHADGGGVHGFTVPELGIDVKVQPRTTQVITLPAAPPGNYAFWCDTCCGGKENPTMQGHLAVDG